MKNKFLVITDLEATCWGNKTIEDQKWQRDNSEIIEIGAIKVSLLEDDYLKEIKRFDVFVKPVKHPTLSDFCKKLTSITQEQVDRGLLFETAIESFKKDMFDDPTTIFGSWGKYDFNFIQQQCNEKEISIPFNTEKVVNLKSLVATIKGWKKRGRSISRSLQDMSMEFKGTPHRGIDDVVNIRRILLKIGNKLRL